MKRIKVGDVLEIPMGDGYAYAQLSHRDPLMGDLIRVFEDISPTPRADWAALVQQRPLFLTFFYISHGVKTGAVKIVGNAPLPEEARAFPLFLCAGLPDDTTGKPTTWALWDGHQDRFIDQVTPELAKLPLREGIDEVLLKERIRKKWHHEDGVK
jgi:hypothetical protein